MLDRRKFLISSSLIGLSALLPMSCINSSNQNLLVTSVYDNKGNVFASFTNLKDYTTQLIPLADEVHSIIQSPTDLNLFFAIGQYPSTYSALINLKEKKLKEIRSRNGIHFYGHGIFSEDGKHVITTENNFQDVLGLLVFRDVKNLKVTKEIVLDNIGPHDVKRLSDGTLAIAMSGAITHPDHKRGTDALNKDTINSSLIFLDPVRQKTISTVRFPDKNLKFKHLYVSSNDDIYIGFQKIKKHVKSDFLIGMIKHNHREKLIPFDQNSGALLDTYNGHTLSLASSLNSNFLGVTHPAGGSLSIWNKKSKRLIKSNKQYATGVISLDDQLYFLSKDLQGMFLLNYNSQLQKSKIRIFNEKGKAIDPKYYWGSHASVYGGQIVVG